MHPMLTIAIKAARRAGNIINRASMDLDKVTVSLKGENDYVTDIDRIAEEAIIEVLREAYPDHAFIGEETGVLGQSDYKWIIDPLDGTKNFIHGYPNYAVSIALAHGDQITQAVIYDPNRNEIFSASRGGGAFLNDRRIRVSGCNRIQDALISMASGLVAPADATDHLNSEALVKACSGFRRTGTTVLDLAYVACGRLDGYCARQLSAWDSAAGSLLVLEAGGLLGDLQGEQSWRQTGDLLAASPKIFPEMIRLLNKAN